MYCTSLCASKRRSTCSNSAIKPLACSAQLASIRSMRCKERVFFFLLLLTCRGAVRSTRIPFAHISPSQRETPLRLCCRSPHRQFSARHLTSQPSSRRPLSALPCSMLESGVCYYYYIFLASAAMAFPGLGHYQSTHMWF
ncbi:hypothetical protein CI102_10562 [Trichoderma harzianum]|nr:hypothetical protein CI102_10562 [Trichoderma harzianum]